MNDADMLQETEVPMFDLEWDDFELDTAVWTPSSEVMRAIQRVNETPAPEVIQS